MVAAFVALMLAVILYRWVSRPLDRLVDYAERAKAGERVSLPELGNNEIGMMGAAMAEMRSVLEGKDYAEQYVQTLTHELKSPLAAIRSAAELLEEDMADEERRKFIGNIRSETARIQTLIDRMLALAALEKQQSLESTETIVLSELVDRVIDNMQALLASRNVRIDNSVDPDVETQGDAFLLGQAVENLLRNALAFSQKDTSIIVTNGYRADEVSLIINDTGPGMPDYALTRVFERFYSLPAPDTDNKGTGLGLDFVKEVAELHGGRVTLYNHEHQGAVATLTLPRRTT